MQITIVNYEATSGAHGILSKYAERMASLLNCELSQSPNPNSEVNHHINYWRYRHAASPNSVNTLMVTHVDDEQRIARLNEGLMTAHGICFSQDTARHFPGTSVILPAHDMIEVPRSVYIPTNLYGDGRKREGMFFEMLRNIDTRGFEFFVMGSGWKGLDDYYPNVNYLGAFNHEMHVQMLTRCKYALYLGKDEGSMGILDCAHCGLITIAPRTGFHIDIGIDHPFDTQQELEAVFTRIANASRVRAWTWQFYIASHLLLWARLLSSRG